MDSRRLKKVRSSKEGDPRVFSPRRIESKRERHILNELKMLSLLICLALLVIILIARPWQRIYSVERSKEVTPDLIKISEKSKSQQKRVKQFKKEDLTKLDKNRKKREVEVGRRSMRDDVAPRKHRSVLVERQTEMGIGLAHDREDIVGRPSERAQTIERGPVEQTYEPEERVSESDVVRNLPPAYHQRIADRMLTLEALGTDYPCQDFSYFYSRRHVTISYGGRTYKLTALTVLPLPDDRTLRGLLDFFIRAFDERF